MSPTPDPSTWALPKLRIDRDGVWFHDDAEVTHPGIVANLRDNLRVDERGHYLQIGPARVPVEVEDAPFVVERVEVVGSGLAATLNDLSREPVALDTLRVDERGIPRCRVKGGRFDGRLTALILRKSPAGIPKVFVVLPRSRAGRHPAAFGHLRY